DTAAVNEAAGSAAEAPLVPHSPPVSPVREPTPKQQPVSQRPSSPSPTIPETAWVGPTPVLLITNWRPWTLIISSPWKMTPLMVDSMWSVWDALTPWKLSWERLLANMLCQSLHSDDVDDFWRTQDDWIVSSWKLYPKSSVHVLDLTNGKTVYMFVDKFYPIRATLLERMLRHRLTVPPSYCRDVVVAGKIIQMVQAGLRQAYECLASAPIACTARQMVFSSPWLTAKKEFGSPLQTALLASPEQTATGKDQRLRAEDLAQEDLQNFGSNPELAKELLGADVNEGNFIERMTAIKERKKRALADLRYRALKGKPLKKSEVTQMMRNLVKNQWCAAHNDRLLSAQYNLFRPKPAITEPPSKRQRVERASSQPASVPAATTHTADDPDSLEW
ncbi:hypothetical protein Tco_1117661, partial [Tanacetum coccineum]